MSINSICLLPNEIQQIIMSYTYPQQSLILCKDIRNYNVYVTKIQKELLYDFNVYIQDLHLYDGYYEFDSTLLIVKIIDGKILVSLNFDDDDDDDDERRSKGRRIGQIQDLYIEDDFYNFVNNVLINYLIKEKRKKLSKYFKFSRRKNIKRQYRRLLGLMKKEERVDFCNYLKNPKTRIRYSTERDWDQRFY